MFSRIRQWWNNLKLNNRFTIIIIIFLIIPIMVFYLLLFGIAEKNTISKKLSNMDYYMNKSHDQIIKNVNSINMATQFILSDQDLNEYLKLLKSGKPVSTEEVLNFYKVNIAFLERMVNNNPYLYQIRVYADSDNMAEMMPILYRMDRMKKLAWANDEKLEGWKFDYVDNIFDSFVISQDKKIMSLITPIYDYSKGRIGIIEVAMYMETMFPGLYERNADEWNYFVDDDGNIYYGNNEDAETRQYVPEILDSIKNDYTDYAGAYYTKLAGKPVVVGFVQAKELSGTLICIQSAEKELEQIHNLRNLFIIIIILILLLLYIIINTVVKKLLKQLYIILDSMRKVQKGDLDVVIDISRMDEMGELGQQFNKMLTRIKLLMEENIKRELLAKNSEIKALQNQINAHFIYNVLESIKMMAEIEEKYEISDAVTILGKLLRYSMKWDSKTVTVREEIDYIKNYLTLINLRFDYEIYLSTKISEVIYEQQIPKMSLQPIVENAIYHGIEQMAQDTTIYIKGYVDKDDCIIEITDAGKGMTEEEVSKLYKKLAGEIEISGGTGSGIGLKNVQDRIKMAFGEKYGLEIFSKLGCYTKIKVRVPLTVKGEAL